MTLCIIKGIIIYENYVNSIKASTVVAVFTEVFVTKYLKPGSQYCIQLRDVQCKLNTHECVIPHRIVL